MNFTQKKLLLRLPRSFETFSFWNCQRPPSHPPLLPFSSPFAWPGYCLFIAFNFFVFQTFSRDFQAVHLSGAGLSVFLFFSFPTVFGGLFLVFPPPPWEPKPTKTSRAQVKYPKYPPMVPTSFLFSHQRAKGQRSILLPPSLFLNFFAPHQKGRIISYSLFGALRGGHLNTPRAFPAPLLFRNPYSFRFLPNLEAYIRYVFFSKTSKNPPTPATIGCSLS